MSPSDRIAAWLLDLTAAIAPLNRQEWIKAMRAELGPMDGARLRWALGCLLTAAREQLGSVSFGGVAGLALVATLVQVGAAGLWWIIGSSLRTPFLDRTWRTLDYGLGGISAPLFIVCGACLCLSLARARAGAAARRLCVLFSLLYAAGRGYRALGLGPFAGIDPGQLAEACGFALAGGMLLLNWKKPFPVLAALFLAVVFIQIEQFLRPSDLAPALRLLVCISPVLQSLLFLGIGAVIPNSTRGPTPRLARQNPLSA